jgi:hypothetical protein
VFWAGFQGGVSVDLLEQFIQQQLDGNEVWVEDIFLRAPGTAKSSFISLVRIDDTESPLRPKISVL